MLVRGWIWRVLGNVNVRRFASKEIRASDKIEEAGWVRTI